MQEAGYEFQSVGVKAENRRGCNQKLIKMLFRDGEPHRGFVASRWSVFGALRRPLALLCSQALAWFINPGWEKFAICPGENFTGGEGERSPGAPGQRGDLQTSAQADVAPI